MNVKLFSEMLACDSALEKIKKVALIYSQLTIFARELFVSERIAGNEERVLDILRGLNEVHHTLANLLVSYATYVSKAFPVDTVGKQLVEIEARYHLERFLTEAIESIYRQFPNN